MRVVVQRVKNARIEIGGKTYSEIGKGLCIFFGVEKQAEEEDLEWLAKKIIQLRIFSDEQGKMNKSVLDIDGEIMIISQFTLHASTKKGNRPSFIKAENPERAEKLYEQMIVLLNLQISKPIQTGVFGEDMQVSLQNDGPVTILIDTKEKW